MSHPVISVENLSKAYRIGLKEEIPDSLMGAVTSWARAPMANFKRLRRLDTAGSNGDAEDDALGAAGRVVRGGRGGGGGDHRPQRGRQEHAAEDPQPDHRADVGAGRDPGPGGEPAGGRHRLPSRS
jgi:hypothetical protein